MAKKVKINPDKLAEELADQGVDPAVAKAAIEAATSDRKKGRGHGSPVPLRVKVSEL